ncbi:peroxisomal targeting signal 2 receptor [Plakobranchus ocellatus]|uniref:Peroxin-7 n=1 Tax=Plakobranchus ocellatus TaxID=259542 RepID=A0AAV3XYB0_9GAST|nr:peroxisomal targeting signal 2 receptor [Plakobranchus ocellatus]
MNQTFRTQARHGYSVQFSPYFPHRLACTASQYYGIAGCGSLFVLDAFSDGIRPVRVFDWNESLFDLVWAENNENIIVTCSGDGSIQVWDVAQPQGPLKVLKEHTKEVNGIDWSQTRNEHLVISASWDKLLKVWDVSKDQALQTFQGHDHIVYTCCWSPHIPGLFASASGDHTLRLWDTRKPEGYVRLIPAHEAEILSCDWCKYDQNILFSGGVDGLIRGWDVRNPKLPTCELRGHTYAVRRLCASPFQGSIIASASYDFSIKIWDVIKQVCVDTIEHHTEFVYGLDFNVHVPNQMADCGWDELLHVYNTSPYT